jgi:histidine kinase
VSGNGLWGIVKVGEKMPDRSLNDDAAWGAYPDLFERVPCLITVHDRDYKLIKYNREFAEKFDPKPGSFCYTAYKGRNCKCVNCPVEQTFMDGKSHCSEETGVNKDGSVTHWITRTAPIRNEKGEIIAAIEMNLDVTPSKELEEKLARSEKKYHAIFNNIPNSVFVLDFDSLCVVDCNQMVTTVYGYSTDEMIGKSFLDLFREEDREELASRIRTTSVINKARHLKRDAEVIRVDIWISPGEYPGGKVLLVSTSDITRRLETERQLVQAGKMTTLGEMASGIAHELNQPLSVIKTVSSFFLKKINKKEEIDKDTLMHMLAKVDDNVNRATKIINHMRQFARKSEMDFEEVQVAEIIEKACEILKQQLKVRGIHLSLDTPKDIPKILADPDLLEQVFVNLLVNSRDAIEKKWEETGQSSESDRITIKTRHHGPVVMVDVKDTGVGIPKAIVEKIFEPFFTTKEVGKGTGLGLSISYGIVKDFNGTIEVASPNGGGACFRLKFPVADLKAGQEYDMGR